MFECELERDRERDKEREREKDIESVCGVMFTFLCMRKRENIWDALLLLKPAGFLTLAGAAVPSPVHDAVSVQGHEVHLAAASRPHRRKKHLIISLTEELQTLSSFVHEHTV